MRLRRCRFLTRISVVFCISSLGLVLTFAHLLQNWPGDQLIALENELMYGSSVSNKVHITNACISNLFGIPSSFAVSQCLRDGCTNITCDKLFAGDSAAVQAARKFQRKLQSDDEIYKLASECKRLHILGEYRTTSVRTTDVDFPVAFTLLLHTNAEQFERLLRAVYRPQNIYCVHIDTKSPTSFQSAVKAVVSCFHNVFIATHLHHVVYAGPSRLQVCLYIIGAICCIYNKVLLRFQ